MINRGILGRRLALLFSAFLAIGAAAPRDTLYQLPLRWRNDRGAEVRLADLAGKPLVLTFIYTRCGSACPLTVERLKTIENRAAEKGVKARIALVSLEPQRDTPETLATYRSARKLGDDWILLTGMDGDVRTLSVALDYSYRPDDQQKEIFHSNKIALLDSRGVLHEVIEGGGTDLSPLIEKLVALDKSS